MSYVDQALLPGERVIARAQVSLAPLVVHSCWFVVGVALIIGGLQPGGEALILIGGCILLTAVLMGLQHMALVATTEIAATDRRLIGKSGFISRSTIELFSHQVESMQVRQGILGRIFGYGSVTIRGTGSGNLSFKAIAGAIKFRNNFTRTADNASRSVASGLARGGEYQRDLAPTGPAIPAETPPMPIFTVQTVDAASGQEAWIDVTAPTMEDARSRVVATGAITGSVRLKSMS